MDESLQRSRDGGCICIAPSTVCGQTIDFLLSAKRDAEAAKRFFRKALAQPHTVNPRTITVDKNAAYPKAATEMKKDGELWRRSRLRQVKYLNNIVSKITDE